MIRTFPALAAAPLALLFACGSPGGLEREQFPPAYAGVVPMQQQQLPPPMMQQPVDQVPGNQSPADNPTDPQSPLDPQDPENPIDSPDPTSMEPAGPCDATAIFALPSSEGGCTGGCHEAAIQPDLVSEGIVERLRGASNCNGRTYLGSGAGDSFLLEKVSDTNPECGARMPFFAAPLSDESLLCITEWIDAVAGGG